MIGSLGQLRVGLAAMFFLGCGDAGPGSSPIEASRSFEAAPASAPSPTTPNVGMMMGMAGMMAPGEPVPIPAAAGRKIIQNGRVDLVAVDLTAFETRLTTLIAAQGGYVADSERSGSTGETRHGNWKVRIPSDRFDAFVKGTVALGELVKLKVDTQDVSEEFFDLEARQTSKKVEEARLIKLLADATGKLEEILAVEKELSRVRSEIERMQGRLRVMENLTALATVTIDAREVRNYIPPQAPTFGTRVGRAFAGSVDALRQFGEAVVIFFAGLAPWLPLILVAAGFIVWFVRRQLR